MNTNEPRVISGIYSDETTISQNAHTEGRTTMGTTTIRERLEEQAVNGQITMVDLRAIERYLDKVEYRREYNKRADVVAKRKEYNKKRNEEEKQGRQLLAMLLAERGEK